VEAIASLEDKLERLISKYNRETSSGDAPAWILPPLSCKFVEEVAALLTEDSSAFEFGSGRSTHVLRQASAYATSIEHSTEWLNQTENSNGSITKRAGDFSAVVPLKRCWNRLRLIESFDLEARPELLARLRQAQLILVDSPPNPAKREHALFLALRYSPIGAVIILDDLEVRATARFAHRLARQNARRFRFWNLNIDHQLGIFLRLQSGPIRSGPSLTEFVGTWLRA
jgi:hypothetical protein